MTSNDSVDKLNHSYKFFEFETDELLFNFHTKLYVPFEKGEVVRVYMTENDYKNFEYFEVVETEKLIHLFHPVIVNAIYVKKVDDKKKRKKKI